MSDLSEIKERLNSAVQTKKITDAMYTVSVSMLKKLLLAAENASMTYNAVHNALNDVLLYGKSSIEALKYCKENEGGVHLFAVIMSDRGLCGSYNNELASFTVNTIKENDAVFCFGRRGTNMLKAKNIDPEFITKIDTFGPVGETAVMIGEILKPLFDNGAASAISLIYFDYKSSSPKRFDLFPIRPDTSHIAPEKMYFEPSYDKALDNIVSAYVFSVLQKTVASACASENAKRMDAMQNAGKNAEEMIASLEVKMNILRQTIITNEITETAAAAENINGC